MVSKEEAASAVDTLVRYIEGCNGELREGNTDCTLSQVVPIAIKRDILGQSRLNDGSVSRSPRRPSMEIRITRGSCQSPVEPCSQPARTKSPINKNCVFDFI